MNAVPMVPGKGRGDATRGPLHHPARRVIDVGNIDAARALHASQAIFQVKRVSPRIRAIGLAGHVPIGIVGKSPGISTDILALNLVEQINAIRRAPAGVVPHVGRHT